MKRKTILVGALEAALGIAVVVAGFAAEATRVKRSQLKLGFDGLEPECEYPSSPAMGLAIAATMALVLARAIVTSNTVGCCSRCIPTTNSPIFSRVCIVISWIMSSIAAILFIAGAKLSSQKDVKRDAHGGYYCYTIKPGVFSAAGILGLVSVLLGLVYYFLYVLDFSRTAKKPGLDLELEKQPVTNGKKPTISDVSKPQVPSPKLSNH